MSFKAIFILFLLVTTLTLTHTKPIPAKIYLDQALEDANKKIVIIEFDIDAVPGPEEAKKSSEECWWGPGLCYGSPWGKNSTIQLQIIKARLPLTITIGKINVLCTFEVSNIIIIMSEQGLASPSLLFQSCLILEILTLRCSYYCHMGMHINNLSSLCRSLKYKTHFSRRAIQIVDS